MNRTIILLLLAFTPRVNAAASDGFESTVKPFIRQNCAACHNSKLTSGGLDLARYLTEPRAQALKDRERWEMVVQKLSAGEMPPKGLPRPSEERIAAVTKWIGSEYEREDRAAKPDPGRVTAHRLNRYEYNNTVRDLLGVNLRAADDFPVDPYGYGFDNIGDVLSLSPVLTEKYLKAAERIARAAIPDGRPEPVTAARYNAEQMGQENHLHIQTIHDFPVDGEYTLRSAWYQGLKAGVHLRGRLFLDGKEVSNEPISIYTEMDRGFEARNLTVSQGPHKVEADMEIDPDLKGAKPYLEYIQVRGPLKQTPPGETATDKRIFICGDAPGRRGPECARTILAPLARRAYRRPLTANELDHLLDLVKLAQDRGDSFASGIRVALEAILMSPNFLFRVERDPAVASGPAHRVTDLELASRLSYFLWSSMPDDDLLNVAEKGRLHAPGVLSAQVRRMLGDPKAYAMVENFGGQWLQIRNLDVLKPDPVKFPDYDAQLRDDMRAETEMFFQAIVREDRSILDFLDGNFTFLNERLARHYGIGGVTGANFRRVELDGKERGGVLTQASVLTVSSYPTRTSPVIRGKWVLENILNTPPPPPPPDVPALDEKAVGSTASMRQQLEKHRANAICAGCHARMDPIGFGLENYDAIGRWRAMDGKFPVDASGVLPNGKSFTGAAELEAILKADRGTFVHALVEKILTYALGRGLESYDRPAVERIVKSVESNGFRFSQLIRSTVDSAPFQMRRAETASSRDGAIASSGVNRP
jgi:mono/diheme cytochrome c family protein